MPPNKSIFDVVYEPNRGQWIMWDFTGSGYEKPGKDVNFTEIMVPTKETYRIDY